MIGIGKYALTKSKPFENIGSFKPLNNRLDMGQPLQSLPAGYRYVNNSDAECYVCLDSLKGCVAVTHKDSSWIPAWVRSRLPTCCRAKTAKQGELHPLHLKCMESVAKMNRQCGICRSSLKPFPEEPLEIAEAPLERARVPESAELITIFTRTTSFGALGGAIALAGYATPPIIGGASLAIVVGWWNTSNNRYKIHIKPLCEIFTLFSFFPSLLNQMLIGYGMGFVATINKQAQEVFAGIVTCALLNHTFGYDENLNTRDPILICLITGSLTPQISLMKRVFQNEINELFDCWQS